MIPNPDEINLEDSDDDVVNDIPDHVTTTTDHMTFTNPDEIPLDDSDDDTPVTQGVTQEGLVWSIEGVQGQARNVTPPTSECSDRN